MDIFEKATRFKLRYTTSKGELSVEDLWELSLESLDTIAKTINKKIKEEETDSFIGKRSTTSSKLSLQLDLLKHIINVKQEEAERAKLRAEKQSQREFLKTLLEKKKMDKMESMSVKEIEKQLKALEEEA